MGLGTLLCRTPLGLHGIFVAPDLRLIEVDANVWTLSDCQMSIKVPRLLDLD
jgi:hypothetical protein